MTMKELLRVHREVREVNDDFHSLRTVLRETDHNSKWNFIMFPNDGALSHLPLIGELIIPERYPNDPPVLHLFTKTLRMNVDVYQHRLRDDTQSTMCFDILRPKAYGGTWQPEYTISCLFASLMQALVTPMVPQDYGGDKPEFVTMGRLEEVKGLVEKTYRAHKDHIGHLPAIPTIPATPIPAQPLVFTRPGKEETLKSLDFVKEDMYISQAIYLQEFERPQFWSTLLDLRNLHPGVVFSAILSNKPGVDLVGRKSDTILLRNGVTGTAAKKRENLPLVWFYHGKPLNDQNLTLSITITSDQFTMAYKAEGSDKFLVHGDTPISKLGEAQIGNIKGIPFYLTIYLKRKYGDEGFISVLDQKEIGYIHAKLTTLAVHQPSKPISPPINLVRLNLGSEQTARLQGVIDVYGLGLDFKVQKSITKPAYLPLASACDMPENEWTEIVKDVYGPLLDKSVEAEVTAIAADKYCVVLILKNHRCFNEGKQDEEEAQNGDGNEKGEEEKEKGEEKKEDEKVNESKKEEEEELSLLSADKISCVTMRLRDESIKANYPAIFAQRMIEEHAKDWVNVGDTYIQLPQPIKITCHVEFEG
jgi:ubiquitin-protein ligase